MIVEARFYFDRCHWLERSTVEGANEFQEKQDSYEYGKFHVGLTLCYGGVGLEWVPSRSRSKSLAKRGKMQ